MIAAEQLREEIIRPTLKHIGLYSLAAEELLMGTAAQESRLGRYLKQLGGGPALGIYQMEPATHRDILDNWLRYRPALDQLVSQLVASKPRRLDQLVSNLAYATAMSRIYYRRIPAPLPAHDDLPAQAAMYKRYYNTHLGKATEGEYIENYKELVAGGESG